MMQVVCSVCYQPQHQRDIERDGAPWTEWYCPTHGTLAFHPKTEWQVSETPVVGPSYRRTPLGEVLLAIRRTQDGEGVENAHRLYDMAKRLGVGSAELSAIEFGRTAPPDGFAERVARAYVGQAATLRALVEDGRSLMQWLSAVKDDVNIDRDVWMRRASAAIGEGR
jgi:hypothetical protein